MASYNLRDIKVTQSSTAGGNCSIGFRPEIEGLRAVAVIAVILFHAGFKYIPGGFLGVDIFFVISGFLITSNIMTSVARGDFSFSEFYLRRVLRLLPALATTVFFTLFLSFLLLPPDQVLSLAKSALSSLMAVSNIYFWRLVGYFDTGANLKPLLHTWSLGVEEQFYLLWPASLLLIIRSLGKLAVYWIISAAGIVSLIGAYLFIEADPSAVFYLMPFRVFEFTIGASLALPQFSRKPKSFLSCILAVVGLLSILFSIAFFNSKLPMPGIYSLAPCMGTAAVIYGGNVQPAAMLLSSRVMTFIGRISYSLYLVHWPVIIFTAQAGWKGVPGILLGLVICLLTAVLQFYCIEQPLRRSNRRVEFVNTKVAVSSGVILLVLAISVATYGLVTDGLRFRLPPELQAIPSAVEMWAERDPTVNIKKCFLTSRNQFSDFNQNECLSIKPGSKNYLVVGDSTAGDLFSALSQAYPDLTFLQATSGNCRPIRGNDQDKNCADLLDFIFDDFVIHHSIDGVILSGIWSNQDLDAIDDTIEYLKLHVDNVILAGIPVMFLKNPTSLIFESGSKNIEDIERFVFSKMHPGSYVNQLLIDRFAANVPFIDIQKAMCLKGCHIFNEVGKIIFIDFAHLTVAGATYLSKNILQLYPDLLTHLKISTNEK